MTAAEVYDSPCPDSTSVRYKSRAEWLQARHFGIGGSEISSILGMSRWASPRDVWLDKTGQGSAELSSWPIMRGNALEGPLLQWFRQETGQPVTTLPLQRNINRPWMIGSVDGVSGDGIVEAKTASWRIATQDWADGPADHAELQIQWYMAVTGLRHGWIVAALGDDDPTITPVDRNDALIATLVSAAGKFWHDYVVAEVEPPLMWMDREAVMREFPRVERTVAEGDADIDRVIHQRNEAAARMKTIEHERDQLDAQIIKALGDADHLVIGGEIAATRKEQTSSRFDKAAAIEAGLDLTPYMTTSTTRVLRVPVGRKPFKESN